MLEAAGPGASIALKHVADCAGLFASSTQHELVGPSDLS